MYMWHHVSEEMKHFLLSLSISIFQISPLSDNVCVDICIRCDQSMDTLTMSFACCIVERSLPKQLVHTHKTHTHTHKQKAHA